MDAQNMATIGSGIIVDESRPLLGMLVISICIIKLSFQY
jgi:hypothetical protein